MPPLCPETVRVRHDKPPAEVGQYQSDRGLAYLHLCHEGVTRIGPERASGKAEHGVASPGRDPHNFAVGRGDHSDRAASGGGHSNNGIGWPGLGRRSSIVVSVPVRWPTLPSRLPVWLVA